MISIALLLFSLPAQSQTFPVLADLRFLEGTGAKVLASDSSIGVGYAQVSPAIAELISRKAHDAGRCGGFERLPEGPAAASGESLLKALKAQVSKDRRIASTAAKVKHAKSEKITLALNTLKEENLKSTVEWLSSFPSRSHRLGNPNLHVDALEQKVRDILASYPGMWQLQQIRHSRTRQNSLMLRLEGAERPSEIVVLGGHLDSINSGWGGGQDAPGADDNASGSANLLEALRVLSKQGRPSRSIEFFWYAGEEGGLLGSAEIAQKYRAENKDVIAVLQLDMTIFPGAGEFVVGNVTDFTSSWLRGYLESINETYLGVRLIPDECGYACSDHASWYRQSYPTLMPFESDTGRMNRKIHTDRDRADQTVSFRHSLVFAKIALIMAMDLGNSSARQP